MENRARKLKKENLQIFAKGSIDILFFSFTIIILAIGLLMMFSASYPSALNKYGNSFHYINRQLIWAVIGLVAMIVMSKVNYRLLMLATVPLAGVTLVLLALVLVLPEVVPGFKRWIAIGPLTFQPSDIAKFALVLVLAHYISTKSKKEMETFKFGALIPGAMVVVTAGLVLIEKHISGTILIALIGITLMFIGGTKKRYFLFALGLGIVLVCVVMAVPSLRSHAMPRINAWLDKDYDPLGDRWQTNNSLYAIGSGGLMGAGLGNSKQKFLYVSEPQNDFIFSIVCEELGLVGASVIIALFVLLIWRGFVIASKAQDKFGTLLVMGIVSKIGIQVMLNLLVITDSIPNTGIAFPFFSYGGTALMMQLFEVGVVLSVSRQANMTKV